MFLFHYVSVKLKQIGLSALGLWHYILRGNPVKSGVLIVFIASTLLMFIRNEEKKSRLADLPGKNGFNSLKTMLLKKLRFLLVSTILV